jgi:hypothetical protein
MLTSEMYFYSRLVFTVIIRGLEPTLCQGCPWREGFVERGESTSEMELSRIDSSGVGRSGSRSRISIR